MALATEAVYHQGNHQPIDYTPSGADVAAGEVVLLGTGLAGVANSAISDGELGAIDTGSIYKLTKEVGGGITFTAGDEVNWDDTANEAVAGANGDARVGIAVADAADNDDHVKVLLNARVSTAAPA